MPGPLMLLVEVASHVGVLLLFGLPLGVWITGRLRLPPIFVPVVVLASACLQGYALFFMWFFSARAATLLTRLMFIVSVGVAVLHARRVKTLVFRRESVLAVGQMLVLSYGCLLLLGAKPTSPTTRFSVHLPSDFAMPLFLADRFDREAFTWQRPQPSLGGDFQASDRPPLQSAMVLVVRSLIPSTCLASYQVIGTVCQSGWVLAFYALAAAFGLSRQPRAFALVATACSGFVLLNSVYVWPKLLSGWLFVTALAVAFYPGFGLGTDRTRPAPTRGRLVGAAGLAALSLLAHGGAAFSLVAAPLLFLKRELRTRLAARDVMIAALVATAVLAPWTMYQKLVDPPGDRLVRIHLAGVATLDSRSVARVIWDQYRTTPPRDLVGARIFNLREQWLTPSGRTALVPWLQWQQFFHMIPALGVISVGLLIVGLRRIAIPEAAPYDLRWLLFYGLVTWCVWILLMFSPHTALLHHGSYANVLVLFFLGAVGLARLPTIVGGALLALHGLVFAVGWLELFEPMIGVRVLWLDAGLLCLVAFVLLAWLPERRASSRSVPS